MNDSPGQILGIYKIINQVNGKIYIGGTKNIQNRWRQHKSALRNGKHHNPHLQNAFNKYDISNFKFTIIEEVKSVENLVDREQYFLDTLEPEYNIIPKADHHEISEETKRKIGKANKGNELSEDRKKKMSEAAKKREITWGDEISKALQGHEVSEETKRKIGEANSGEKNGNYGKHLTKATKQKMSEATRGENHPQSKLTEKKVKIIKYLLDGNHFLQKDIASMFRVGNTTICDISNGKVWSHIEI